MRKREIIVAVHKGLHVGSATLGDGVDMRAHLLLAITRRQRAGLDALELVFEFCDALAQPRDTGKDALAILQRRHGLVVVLDLGAARPTMAKPRLRRLQCPRRHLSCARRPRTRQRPCEMAQMPADARPQVVGITFLPALL